VSGSVRVAAAQFATGTDLGANLATTLRMIDAAATERAQVIVLPEFCNHLSIYDDGAHAWEVAIDLDGPWTAEVAARAARHGAWIQLNCTVRRDGPSTSREPAPGRITNTNLLFSPAGHLAAANDKTVLMGAEGDFLSAATTPAEVVDAGFGRLGTYACMDGVITEVPRALALRGADLLLNSLNSFALDEASLHIPVRAAENRVWVVACCKVGPLLPEAKVEAFSTMMGIPADALRGAGESQIVAPDGTVVARGPRDGEAVVAADIDVGAARAPRPDGTDLRRVRRPEAYTPLSRPTPALDDHPRADRLEVAALVDPRQVASAAAAGAELIVLPELAVEVDDLVDVAADLAHTAAAVVTSVRDGDAHLGVVVTAEGVIARQPQLHRVARHRWVTRLGDALDPVELSWGRLAVVVGDDAVHPEVARLAALAACDVLAVPFDAQERWECELGLVERAAENRVCLVAATRPSPVGTSLVVTLPPDFTLWAPSRERTFDGTINRPDVLRAPGDGASDGSLHGVVHPARAVNRQISKGTNLVDGRPWQLAGALVTPTG